MNGRLDKPTQEGRVLQALLDRKGEWVNGQYFLRTLLLSQYHRAIWNLENRPQWKQKLAQLNVTIEHGEFADEYGFKSYRAVSTVPAGQLFNTPQPEKPADPTRFIHL